MVTTATQTHKVTYTEDDAQTKFDETDYLAHVD